MDGRAISDLRADATPRVEAAVGVLEDDLHTPASLAPIASRQSGKRQPVEIHFACGRLQQSEQQPTECTLARSRLADNAGYLAFSDAKVDVGDGLDVPLGLK